MAGLKGLTRADADTRIELANKSNDDAAAAFIGSAPVRSSPPESREPELSIAKKKKPAGAKFKRTNFSLDDKTNKLIDKISLKPRTFKVNRSDVVRAGALALQAMDSKDLIKLLAFVSGAEGHEEETQQE